MPFGSFRGPPCWTSRSSSPRGSAGASFRCLSSLKGPRYLNMIVVDYNEGGLLFMSFGAVSTLQVDDIHGDEDNSDTRKSAPHDMPP